MIALIDYDAGNTCSVMNALKRIGVDFVLTDDITTIKSADKVIFPGVGHAKSAMEALSRKSLVDVIKNLNQPVLGICVGLQLLCESSEEGDTTCLGIIPGRVKKFDANQNIKVPHMGWNQLQQRVNDPVWKEVGEGSYVYFVHSYYVPSSEYMIGSCTYDVTFAAAIRKDNFWGVQFHTEKSGDVGERILNNFINLKN